MPHRTGSPVHYASRIAGMLAASQALLAVLADAIPALAADSLDAVPQQAELTPLDIVLMAAVGYILWRIITTISRRKPRGDDNTYDVTPEDRAAGPDENQAPDERRARNARAAWDYLSGDRNAGARPEAPPVTGSQGPDVREPGSQNPDAPGTFDEKDFLRGAKVIYGRIRQSLAMRNLADLRQFCAPDMMREFERLAQEKPDREVLVVTLVEAAVLDVKQQEKQTMVEVAYEATLSDDPTANSSRKVSEVWRFSRDETSRDAMWLLESVEKTQ